MVLGISGRDETSPFCGFRAAYRLGHLGRNIYMAVSFSESEAM